MQKITPFLWFDAQAEEAVAFYLSVFTDGKIHATTRYPDVPFNSEAMKLGKNKG